MPSYFGHFVHRQWVLNVPKPTASFASKVAIVTGGNSGLGKESVKHLVRLGASKVIIACRNKSKGEQAKLEILSSMRCSVDVLEVWELDIESPTSIKAFVDRANRLDRLDALLNNAGVSTVKYKLSYGTEQAVGVNVIGTILLAIQLVPKLKETARAFGVTPHMTFTQSALYRLAKYPENPGDDIFAYMGNEKNVLMASPNQ
jgi:retinol dehydrogenase 12